MIRIEQLHASGKAFQCRGEKHAAPPVAFTPAMRKLFAPLTKRKLHGRAAAPFIAVAAQDPAQDAPGRGYSYRKGIKRAHSVRVLPRTHAKRECSAAQDKAKH